MKNVETHLADLCVNSIIHLLEMLIGCQIPNVQSSSKALLMAVKRPTSPGPEFMRFEFGIVNVRIFEINIEAILQFQAG